MTSSYFRTSLRISKLRSSTVRWARSMALETILASMGTSAGEALGVAAEDDVDSPAGHVGGHRDRPDAASLGDDQRFLLVLLGVEDGVGDAPLLQLAGEVLRLLDRDRAHEDGLAGLVALDEV